MSWSCQRLVGQLERHKKVRARNFERLKPRIAEEGEEDIAEFVEASEAAAFGADGADGGGAGWADRAGEAISEAAAVDICGPVAPWPILILCGKKLVHVLSIACKLNEVIYEGCVSEKQRLNNHYAANEMTL